MRVFDLDTMLEALNAIGEISIDVSITVDALKAMLSKCESVDAANVVKCKNCKHLDSYVGAFGAGTICALHSGENGAGYIDNPFFVEADWFCASGERENG